MLENPLAEPEIEYRPPRVGGLLIGSVIATAIAGWIIPFANRWTDSTTINSALDVVQIALVLGGVSAAAMAVFLRPRFTLGLATAALSAGQAALAIPPDWETIRMAMKVASMVAVVCAILVWLPRWLQRWAVSLAILFHFGGILVAVTSVPPPFAAAPWLATQLWIRVYRPYFQFMYLFNAYHFYSPDPGPATMLWTCINYSDDSHKWVKMPDRQEHMKDPLAVCYYRRLSLTEAANQLLPPTTVSAIALENRALTGLMLGIPTPERIAMFIPSVAQFREPTAYSKQVLKSYAQRLAINNAPAQPTTAITGIKIYRVTHVLLSPRQAQSGKEPTDADLYLPYFQGDFDINGNLKDPGDPMLYWLIPIINITNSPVRPTYSNNSSTQRGYEFANYLDAHAASRSIKGQP